MHKLFREQGVDDMMKKHNVDVIIGPSDSFLSSIATFTGMMFLLIIYDCIKLTIKGTPLHKLPFHT